MLLASSLLAGTALGGLTGAFSPAASVPTYDGDGQGEVIVTIGKRYLWTPGINDTSLVNADSAGNSESFTTATDFIAWGATVVLHGTPAAIITASLQPQTGWSNHLGGLMVQSFRKHPMLGERRLFYVGMDGFINLYEYGFTDALADQFDVIAPREIEDELLTRGYACGELSRKRFQRAQLNISTWDPEMSVDAVFDGINEIENVQEDVAKDRTLYDQPFDADPYDVNNDNDDHGVEFRENYSVQPPEAATLTIDNSGFDPDLHQESTERFKVPGVGTYCQLRIRNARGRLAVLNTFVQAKSGPRREGTLS